MNPVWSELNSRLAEVSSGGLRELSLITESVVGLPADRFLLQWVSSSLPDPTEGEKEELCRIVARRCDGEPLQYLLGSADFYGRSFAVAPGVLIPRFDTEILIDTALPFLTEESRVLDLCAGTGCIGLTLAAETGAAVTELEKYDGAFALLEKNAAAHCPSARLLRADLFEASLDGTFDMIVSNPPYIPTADLGSLSPEVRKEPVTALDGGEDGLLFYRAILRRFLKNLRPGGRILFECGIGQAAALEDLLLSHGCIEPVRIRDYGGVERVVGAKKPKGVS